MKTALFCIGLLALTGCATPPRADASFRDEMSAFLQTAPARKLSPALQRNLLALEEKEGSAVRLHLLLGLKNTLTDAEKSLLQQAGVVVRSAIGSVATAVAPAEAMPDVASFDFIESIEISTPLQPKPES